MTINKDLRLSYSLANQYEELFMKPYLWGDKRFKEDQAQFRNSLYGRPNPTNLAMYLGNKCHSRWEQETIKTGKNPKVFQSFKIEQPVQAEQRIEHRLADDVVLSAVVDLVTEDKSHILDHKMGQGDIGRYTNSKQPGVYALVFPEAKEFTFQQYNPWIEVSPLKFFSDLIRTGKCPALKSYLMPLFEIQEGNGYKDGWFYLQKKMEMTWGSKLVDESLEKELDLVTDELFTLPHVVRVASVLLDEETRESALDWLDDIAQNLIARCQEAEIPYHRLYDRETGAKL